MVQLNIKQQREKVLKECQQIIDRAKSEDRDVTEDEHADLEAKFSQIRVLDEHIAKAKKSEAIMGQMESAGSGHGWQDYDPDGKGGLFNAEQKDGLVKAVRMKTPYATTVQFKAPALVSDIGLPTAGKDTYESPAPAGTVALRSLFQQQNAESGMVRYYVVGTGTAGIVAEGGLKPDAGITTEAKDAELVKIATTFKYSDELGEDANYLVASIGRQAVMSVIVKENEQVVQALGNTSGILTATGAATDALDVIASEIGDQQAINGLTPSALVLNPTNLAAIRTAKAATGGQYFIDPLSSGPTSVHGVPLVPTAAVAPGTMYLVSQGAGAFYTRGRGLRLEAGLTGDDFVTNMVTVRVEERVLPVVTMPSLVTKITLT